MLQTPSDIIKALGGTKSVCVLLRVGASAISNYRRNGFPARTHYILAETCKQAGFTISATALGIQDDTFFSHTPPATHMNGMDIMEQHFVNAGFTPIETPMLQPIEPFLNRMGEEMRQQLYSFTTPIGEQLCLRPELTIPVARIYLESPQYLAQETVRYCYQGKVFQYHAGHNTESRQVGIEIINGNILGHQGIKDEVEIIKYISEALMQAGVSEFQIKLTDRQLFNALITDIDLPQRWKNRLMRSFGQSLFRKYQNQLLALSEQTIQPLREDSPEEIHQLLDKYKKTDILFGRTILQIESRWHDKQEDKNLNSLVAKNTLKLIDQLLLQTRWHNIMPHLRQLCRLTGHIFRDAVDQFETRMEMIQIELPHFDYANCAFLNSNLSGNLTCYSGLMFEIHLPCLGTESAIARGGRYDDLLQEMGATTAIPAVGGTIAFEQLKQKGKIG